METSNVSSALNSLVQRTEATGKSTSSARVERVRGEEASERTQGPRRGGQLLKALSDTLSELGFGAATQKGAPPATASQANDAESAAANKNQDVQQALQGFAFSLFQALGAAGNAPQNAATEETDSTNSEAVAGRGARAYGDIDSRLQNLLQNLSQTNATGATPSEVGSSSATNLESAFENLSKALTSSESGTGSTKMPDLQSFLQTLKQNIQNAGSRLDSSGNLVNTIA